MSDQILICRYYDDGMFRLAPPDIEKPHHLTPLEKIALDKKNEILSDKQSSRQPICWMLGCNRMAQVWVREVGFDFKGPKADVTQHLTISSIDYEGPVPGFCHIHIAAGPSALAERVYYDRPEIKWGVKPERWVVIFTDGTKMAGPIATLIPKAPKTIIKEEHIKGMS